MLDKRANAENYIYELMDQLDPTGENTKRYKNLFKQMSNGQFDNFMQALKNKETQLSVILPNVISEMNADRAVSIAKKRKVPIFSRIKFRDMYTGRPYLSKYPMLTVTLPVRRLTQYLFHKISLPEGDSHVNPVSGQVIPPDKGAAISAIETQVLASKGLQTSIIELIKIRAGDVNAYKAAKLKIEESGSVSMTDIPLSGRPRSAITAQKYLHAMMIDSNL